jgi:hypothetical protein
MEILAAKMQRFALLDATFYSIGVISPTPTLVHSSYTSDAPCYASLHAADPNLRPTLAVVAFFVATPLRLDSVGYE